LHGVHFPVNSDETDDDEVPGLPGLYIGSSQSATTSTATSSQQQTSSFQTPSQVAVRSTLNTQLRNIYWVHGKYAFSAFLQ